METGIDKVKPGVDKDLLLGTGSISSRMGRDWRTCAKILDAKCLLHKEAGQYTLHWPTYLKTLAPGWKPPRRRSNGKKSAR